MKVPSMAIWSFISTIFIHSLIIIVRMYRIKRFLVTFTQSQWLWREKWLLLQISKLKRFFFIKNFLILIQHKYCELFSWFYSSMELKCWTLLCLLASQRSSCNPEALLWQPEQVAPKNNLRFINKQSSHYLTLNHFN